MPKIFRQIALGLALGFALAHVPANAADNPPVNTGDSGYAIHGYDPVAYFADGEPRPGDPAYAHEWNGATWLFASAEHRDTFAADPERYAPQFGGYCAYAVAKGKVANGDPRVWSIVDDRLYLNLGPSVQTLWEEDVKAHIAAAMNNWPEALVDPGRRSKTPETASDR